jgi:hypothetical protein
MLSFFMVCALLGCDLQAPTSRTDTDGLEPPPGVGSGPFPNAPIGTGWVTAHDAEWTLPPVSNTDREPDNGSGLGVWGDRSVVALTDVPSAPWQRAAGRAITIKLPQGMAGGSAMATVMQQRDAYGRQGPLVIPRERTDGSLYIGFWVRHRGSGGQPYTPLGAYPAGREPNVGQKWIYLKSAGVPDSFAFAHILIGFVNVGAPGSEMRRMFPNWHPQFRDQAGASGCQSTSQGAAEGSPSNGINDEQWHLIEYLILPNSFGNGNRPNRDGVARIWLDGRMVMDRRDLINYCSLQAEPDGRVKWPITEVSLEPIYGGGLWPVPYDLFIDYGRIRLMYHER